VFFAKNTESHKKKLRFYQQNDLFSMLLPIHPCIHPSLIKKSYSLKIHFPISQGTRICVNKRFSNTDIFDGQSNFFPMCPSHPQLFVMSLSFDQTYIYAVIYTYIYIYIYIYTYLFNRFVQSARPGCIRFWVRRSMCRRKSNAKMDPRRFEGMLEPNEIDPRIGWERCQKAKHE
jgi:hypothetical protein